MRILPYRILALLDTAIAALLYRVALWLDGLVIGPHVVRCDAGDAPHSPAEPDDRLDFAVIAEALRKANK